MWGVILNINKFVPEQLYQFYEKFKKQLIQGTICLINLYCSCYRSRN